VVRQDALSFYDTSMTRVVEPGTFTIFTGVDAEHTSEAHFRLETPNGAPVAVPERCER
jgi:hypothetical protein